MISGSFHDTSYTGFVNQKCIESKIERFRPIEMFSLDGNGTIIDMRYTTSDLFLLFPKPFLVDEDFCVEK